MFLSSSVAGVLFIPVFAVLVGIMCRRSSLFTLGGFHDWDCVCFFCRSVFGGMFANFDLCGFLSPVNSGQLQLLFAVESDSHVDPTCWLLRGSERLTF